MLEELLLSSETLDRAIYDGRPISSSLVTLAWVLVLFATRLRGFWPCSLAKNLIMTLKPPPQKVSRSLLRIDFEVVYPNLMKALL